MKIRFILVSCLIILFTGCSPSGDKTNNTKDKNISTATATPTNKKIEKENDVKNSNKFIFPDSDKRVLNQTELKSCDKFTLLLAKNELFARKGYKFKDTELLEYFKNLSWYSPNDLAKEMLDELNDVEKQNFNIISKKYDEFQYDGEAISKNQKLKNFNFEKDLNNDGVNESVTAVLSNHSNYTISVNSKGKEYKINGTSQDNSYLGLFLADLDVNDNYKEFYIMGIGLNDYPFTTIFHLLDNDIKEIMTLDGFIRSYDGKGKIYTDYSKTTDKNKITLSFYDLNKGLTFSSKSEVVGKYLQYDKELVLFKSKSPGPKESAYMSLMDVGENIKKENIVKIAKKNEKLKIIDLDINTNTTDKSPRNIPIKVETEDNKQGWLVWLNGGV